MERVIKHLERIAKANKDEFRFYIEIVPFSKGIVYTFKAEEVSDNHVFLEMGANSLEILQQIISPGRILEACKSWEYKYVG